MEPQCLHLMAFTLMGSSQKGHRFVSSILKKIWPPQAAFVFIRFAFRSFVYPVIAA